MPGRSGSAPAEAGTSRHFAQAGATGSDPRSTPRRDPQLRETFPRSAVTWPGSRRLLARLARGDLANVSFSDLRRLVETCGSTSDTYQSFNLRDRTKVKPYYDLIANIATEEYGHIELVSAVINGMLSGAPAGEEPHDTPLKGLKDGPGLRHDWIKSVLGALPVNSLGQGWNGEYVFNSGDLVLELLHNFFLENGARMAKIRVYEATDGSFVG